MSAAKVYDFEYDRTDQLTAATLKTTDPTPTVLKRYVYAYDPAGNRTSEQIDNGVVSALHNNMNQTTSLQPGGMLRLGGTTNEAANVTVGGLPARILDGNRFEGETPVGSGTTAVPVVATDGSGNARTYTYNVSVSGSTKTLTYDGNGNLLSDGTRTFEWDSLDQLTAINQGTHRSEFTYDSDGRRVRVVELEGGTPLTDRRFVWYRNHLLEERSTQNGVTRRYVTGGTQEEGVPRFLVADHLGSVRAATDGQGSVIAAYDYTPYGARSGSAGSSTVEPGYALTQRHSASGLNLARYRVQDPDLGRWMSTDPAGMRGGLNLYVYADANPINKVDPFGLSAQVVAPPAGPVADKAAVDAFINWLERQGGAEAGGAAGGAARGASAASIGGMLLFLLMQQHDGRAQSLDDLLKDGIPDVDPNNGCGRNGNYLHRPYIRAWVWAAVWEATLKTHLGVPIDPNTRLPIIGHPQLGHKPGFEWWRLRNWAQRLCLTQEELNEIVQDPDWYVLEQGESNASHKHEKPPFKYPLP